MPREEHVISIFLASPGDVQKERTEVKDAIEEFNVAWSRDLGIRLVLSQWETDAFPSVGIDAQDIINHQIPSDYDIFFGIMWHRLGTATCRAPSGTVEEFERALARFKRDPSGIDIMFYFKTTKPPPTHNPAQHRMVGEFRKQVASHGALFWEFNDRKAFGKHARLHLTRQVQKSQVYKRLLKAGVNSVASERDSSEDLIDTPITNLLSGNGNSLSSEYIQAANALLQVQKNGTLQFELRAAEILDLRLRVDANLSQAHTFEKEFLRWVTHFSSDLQKFATSLNLALTNYLSVSDGGLNSFISDIIIFVGGAVAGHHQNRSQEFLLRISKWLKVLEELKTTACDIRDVIKRLEDVNTEFKLAKRAAVQAVERLMAHREVEFILVREGEQIMLNLIEDYSIGA